MANGEKKTSPWVWVGVGCLGVTVVGIAVIAGISYWGYRTVRRMADDLKDPVSRERRVKEVLGADMLPPGYHPVVAISVPFIMEMAILSDREPDEGGQTRGFEERGFIYVKMLGVEKQQRELQEFFEGKRDDAEILRQHSIRMRQGDVVARGGIEGDDLQVMYVAHRGGIDVQNAEVDGVTSLLLVQCREDKRTRLGIWFAPDPDPSKAPAEADFTGSPGDEKAIRTFIEHFDFCHP